MLIALKLLQFLEILSPSNEDFTDIETDFRRNILEVMDVHFVGAAAACMSPTDMGKYERLQVQLLLGI